MGKHIKVRTFCDDCKNFRIDGRRYWCILDDYDNYQYEVKLMPDKTHFVNGVCKKKELKTITA